MGKYAAQRVNHGMGDEMEIEGFRWVGVRFWLTILFVILSGGVLLILLTWKKSIKLWFTHVRCALQDATTVLLTDKDGTEFEESVKRKSRGKFRDEQQNTDETFKDCNVYFYNRQVKYVWDASAFEFYKISGKLEDVSLSQIHGNMAGLSQNEGVLRLSYYGENKIKVRVLSIWGLLTKEALNPFYLIQAYSFIVWSLSGFYYYALILLGFTVLSITLSLWETRRQSLFLCTQIKENKYTTVVRNGLECQRKSSEVVPGDLMIIPSGGHFCISCDAVLLNGSVTVNEAALTGDSIPIPKEAAIINEDEIFNQAAHSSHVLYCGSEVIQVHQEVEEKVRARVIATGYGTAKGTLLQQVLHQKSLHFRFYTDLWRSIPVLFCLAAVAAAYSMWFWKHEGASGWIVLLCGLDILTYMAPPLLPAALTSINSWAQKALKKKGIYCISSKDISICGTLDLVCFDKTGTLTEDNHDIVGVVIPDDTGEHFQEAVTDPTHLPENSNMASAMAACQTLTKDKHGFKGYPLDLTIFQSINWELEEKRDEINPNYNLVTRTLVRPQRLSDNMQGMTVYDLEIAILKTFPFNPTNQTMAVITKRRHGNNYEMFIKGSAEKVIECCDSMSVPDSFQECLTFYERQGYLIVVLAWKPLNPLLQWSEIIQMKRSELEDNAEFLGFIIMRNMLRGASVPSIQQLKEADITCTMVTGDALYTAINVAKESRIVDVEETVIIVDAELEMSGMSAKHVNITYRDPEAENRITKLSNKSNFRVVHGDRYVFALTGRTFDLLEEYEVDVFKKVIHRGRVFARMLPVHKTKLVQALQGIGHQVGMCGDGCNDCGAMRAAKAGVSVAMQDTSLAAPFTSVSNSITCIPQLIRKGRATLVSATCAFKYGVAVKFSMLFCVLLSYNAYCHISDVQMFGYEFIGCAVPLLTLGMVKSHPWLNSQPPAQRIFHYSPLVSIFSFVLLQLGFQVFLLQYFTKVQPWNDDVSSSEPLQFTDSKPSPTFSQSALYLSVLWGSVSAAIIFSPGRPYRRPFYTNRILMVWLGLWSVLVLLLTIGVPTQLAEFFNTKVSPELGYQFALLGIGFINVCICYIWETQLLQLLLHEQFTPFVSRLRWPNKPYEEIEAELRKRTGWPPIGQTKVEVKPDAESFEEAKNSSKWERKSIKRIPLFSRGASSVSSKGSVKCEQNEEDAEVQPLRQEAQKERESAPWWTSNNRMSFKTFRKSIKNRGLNWSRSSEEKDEQDYPMENINTSSVNDPFSQNDSSLWVTSTIEPPTKHRTAGEGDDKTKLSSDDLPLPAPPQIPHTFSMYSQPEDEADSEMFSFPLPPPPLKHEQKKSESIYAQIYSRPHLSTQYSDGRESSEYPKTSTLKSFKPVLHHQTE